MGPDATAIATVVASAVPAPAMTAEIAMAIIGAAHSVVDITVAVAGAVPSPAAPTAAERFHKDSTQRGLCQISRT